MEELIQQTLSVLRAMWLRRWVGLIVAFIVAIVGAVIVVRLPDRYEASARVYVDTQTVLKPLMSGLTVQPDINQQITLLARTLITRPNMEKLMRSADLDLGVNTPAAKDALTDDLITRIKLQGGGRENIYDISIQDPDPEKAKRIVQNLVSMFVESGIGSKRRDSETARRFIDDQIKAHEKRLQEAEQRLKDFKLRNLGAGSSTNGQDYFGRITALNEEVARLKLELRASEQSRDAIKRELAGEDPVILPEPGGSGGSPVPEIDARIEAQKKSLDELLRRFTEQHPDVMAARRLIVQLEDQKRQELEARKKAAINSTGRYSASTNPVFQQLKISLAEQEANVASLRARMAEQQSRLDQMRGAASKVPEREIELSQMNRDYEVLKRNYEQLIARRESASMSEDVDSTASLADFRIIDPPRVSPKAAFPNRLAFASLALLAALGSGVAASFVYSQLFSVVQDAKTLRTIAKRPVLGSVGLLVDAAVVRRDRIFNLAFASGTAFLVLCYGSWIGWLALQRG